MALDIKKFLLRFIDEAREHLRLLNEGVAQLEQGQADAELINSLFRAAHTLKGSSKMLKLIAVTETAHSLEDLLSAVREGRLSVKGFAHAPLLYQAIDTLSALVERLAETLDGQSLPATDSRLCQALTAAATGGAPSAEPEPEAEPEASDAALSPSLPEVPAARLKTGESVRIPLERLDELINLMGEVVSSHTHLRALAADLKMLQARSPDMQASDALSRFNRGFRDSVQQQESLMLELHDRALQLRMLPLSTLFDSAGRLVRETARSLGKQVEFRVQGGEIELDRQMIDQLADPLVHLLRNAMDHGLESTEERIAQGKPEQGRVSLRAWQDGSWAVIEISDDGRGIALDAVREKVLRKELMSEEELLALNEQEQMELIFLPGFSTSAMITELSGRGVGLDVVRTAVVGQLQGLIQIHSRPGEGACFRLRLPLSLAVMRVLLVKAAGHVLGFTAQYVSELIQVPKHALRQVAERNAIILRNEFVPVLRLDELIELPARAVLERRQPQDELRLLIAQVQQEKLALVIDELVDERDLVIKQLPEHLRQQPLIAGMVSSGHNELVSLLHVPRLLEMARRRRSSAASRPATSQQQQRILVVDDSLNTREIEKDVLEAWGYQVTLAENGQEGLRKALAEEFDAVLTDVEMPVMDGFTLTARLRQEERYRNRPIVIITSREKESDRRRGIEVGADAYIVKGSFDQSSLVETLRVLLG